MALCHGPSWVAAEQPAIAASATAAAMRTVVFDMTGIGHLIPGAHSTMGSIRTNLKKLLYPLTGEQKSTTKVGLFTR
ncbi:hypothetical protein GZL_04363 [Streptomyces sp. 769]|nr:hypothetical protein GZL_04363 [Streptomyces sp. 769]